MMKRQFIFLTPVAFLFLAGFWPGGEIGAHFVRRLGVILTKSGRRGCIFTGDFVLWGLWCRGVFQSARLSRSVDTSTRSNL